MNAPDIRKLKDDALGEGRVAGTADALEAVRVKYVGRNGWLPRMMKELKDVAPEDRAEAGRAANEFKQEISALIDGRKAELSKGTSAGVPVFDGSLPGRWPRRGVIHPISRVIDDTIRILARLGFTVAEGPDVETRHHNFDALNTAAHHPSLDPEDTFWFETGELLRTQTSPVQIRVMESRRPPIRIITPGRCYRRDTTDATHSANFHQVEGLYVDRRVSLADLKGTMTFLFQEMMSARVKVRFRPHFFPFTEPSVECDFSCHVCGGKGCKVCKNSGWIEIAGAGMVDPRVFRNVGYDPESFTGFAFGFGVERVAMIKYGVHDIRWLYENDLRYLEQFV